MPEVDGLEPVYILYIGRKQKIAREIEVIIAADDVTTELEGRGLVISYHIVTNQKAALSTIRQVPPHLVFVEVDKRADSRTRFCQMLQYRLPTAIFISVSAYQLQRTFKFHHNIQIPLAPQQVFDVLMQGLNGFEGDQIELGHIRLNLTLRKVSTRVREFHMTPKQCALLHLLMQNHKRVVPRKDIMEMIWDTSYMDDTRTLDVHIRWLRQCIEPNPSKPVHLVTVRGIGYRLNL